MNIAMTCKSCGSNISSSMEKCPNCHISSPKGMSEKKKKTLIASLVIGIIIIVVIPMTAALLWMQAK